jgi:hypothetical protein
MTRTCLGLLSVIALAGSQMNSFIEAAKAVEETPARVPKHLVGTSNAAEALPLHV